MSATGAAVLAKTQSGDAVKNHILSLNKQLSFEAWSISNVLENCISQTEIVAALPAILHLNSTPCARYVVEDELSVALHSHRLLDERLEGQESQGEDREIKKRSRAQLEKDIKNSVRDLLRLFRAHPDAIYSFRERGVEVGESEYKLISGLKTFHSHMAEELLTSAEEELQQVLSKQACSSPAHYPEHMVRLEEDVAKAIKEMDAEISQKKNEIEHLQCSLQSGMQNAVMLQAATQSNTDIKTSGTETGLTQEIDQLKIQLNNLILENAEAERELKEKCEKVKTETDDLIQKFDIEIQEHQNNLDLNENDYEKEEEEFKRLEKPFSILEEECLQIQEKRRLAEEKRQKEMRELELKTKAAILAQAWWRGYSTRKALKNKGKNTKAKKGKGKKK